MEPDTGMVTKAPVHFAAHVCYDVAQLDSALWASTFMLTEFGESYGGDDRTGVLFLVLSLAQWHWLNHSSGSCPLDDRRASVKICTGVAPAAASPGNSEWSARKGKDDTGWDVERVF